MPRALRFLFGWICALLLFLAVCAFALPARFDATYSAALQDKVARLRESESPRVIVIGGSCVPFSLDSSLMEEQLPGYTVVDFGLYAEMGVTVMLDLAAPELRAGDIVVLMPEQSELSLSGHISGETLWQAADGDPLLLTRLDASRLPALAAAFPSFAAKKLYYTLTGGPSIEGIYARDAFDGWGDIRQEARPGNIMPEGYRPDALISFSPSLLSDELVSAVTAFMRKAERAGATVLWHDPPMVRAALAPGTTVATIDAWRELVETRLAIPCLGSPHRCLLDAGWAYDSNFHLNGAGTIVFTKLFIEDLKVWLGDTSVTDITLPAMPASALTYPSGDDGDADLFTYTATEDGWCASGLTDAGRAAASLTVPASWQGAPVTAVSADLFQGCAQLREVTVQANIHALPDGLFSGCGRLERLVLRNSSPSSVTVGDGLTRGASFTIAVPAGAADSYRLSYFWQRYAEWIVEE